MKTFKIGNDRSLKLNKKNDCISIEDKGTKKAAHFTPARLASFLQCLDQIVDQLRRLSEGEDVAYCMHYGGAWHATLTKGIRCVDVRNFFIPTVESYKDRHRPTSQRAADVQAGRRQTTPRQPHRRKLHTLLPQTGSRHSRAHRDMSRVQSLSFDHRLTVYPADDYDRKSHWMYIARRRQQFRLRIQQTELILAPILDDVHRLTILTSRCDT